MSLSFTLVTITACSTQLTSQLC